MSFADLLKNPLPSTVTESADDDMTNVNTPEADENDPGTAAENCCKEDDDDLTDPDSEENQLASDALDDDDDDIDLDDLSDEELEALDRELSDDVYDDAAKNEEPVQLDPEEEMDADDMMGVAATTTLINQEMNADEKTAFAESAMDTQIAVNEGLMLESDISDMRAELGLVTEAKNYNKKMIIRLDKAAKMKQLYALGINVSAAAHHDPDYIKLKKINRLRKVQRAKLERKYHSEALKRMKVYFKRLTSSKSASLSALGKKVAPK